MKKENTEIMKKETNEVSIFGEDIKKDLRDNLDGIERLPLPKIKIAKGGLGVFDFGEGMDPKKEFAGYIIGHAATRAHWAKTGDPDKDRIPDCVSVDGRTGSTICHECDRCPKNRFSTVGKATPPEKEDECRASLDLFVMVDGGGDFPYNLKASATSLKYWAPFAVKVTQKGWPILGTRVKFTLKKETAKFDSSISYSTLQYEILGCCENAEAYAKLKRLKETFEGAMNRAKVEVVADDAATTQAPGNDTTENPY